MCSAHITNWQPGTRDTLEYMCILFRVVYSKVKAFFVRSAIVRNRTNRHERKFLSEMHRDGQQLVTIRNYFTWNRFLPIRQYSLQCIGSAYWQRSANISTTTCSKQALVQTVTKLFTFRMSDRHSTANWTMVTIANITSSVSKKCFIWITTNNRLVICFNFTCGLIHDIRCICKLKSQTWIVSMHSQHRNVHNRNLFSSSALKEPIEIITWFELLLDKSSLNLNKCFALTAFQKCSSSE